MDLEIIILSEARQRKKNTILYNLYVESSKTNKQKNDTQELIYKTETNSQISKSNLRLPKGKPW